MDLNIEFDANAEAAPQAFRDAIETAANIIDATFVDPITVNLQVGYGEVYDSGSGSSSPLTDGSAASDPNVNETSEYSYSAVKTLLAQDLSPNVQSGVAALPNTLPIHPSDVIIWSAEEKAFGLLPANDSDIDGYAGFATDIPTDLLVGVALHELTHAMGRVTTDSTNEADIFDLFRFTSEGTRLFGDGDPPPNAPAAYFSLDGGATAIADYGVSSDPSDFLNPPDSNLTPNDPLNEYYTNQTLQTFTATDILQMEALGFHTAAPPIPFDVSSLSISAPGETAFNDPATEALDELISFGLMTQAWQDVGITSTAYTAAGAWDFNGDGYTDLAFRNNATGDWGYLALSADGGQSWHDMGYTSTQYAIAGAGSFDGTTADIAFRDNATGDWGYISVAANGAQTWHDEGYTSTAYAIAGSGDFNDDGITDLAFRNNATGDWGYIALSASGNETWHDMGATNTAYTVIGTADMTGDGYSDLVMRDAATGDWGYYALSGGGTTDTWVDMGISSIPFSVAGSGDFSGDGTNSVAYVDGTTGDWGYATPLANGAYTPIGRADFNGDGISDIAMRDNATGDWGYVALSATGGQTWHDVGITSLAYQALGAGEFDGSTPGVAFLNTSTGDLGYIAVSPSGGQTWHDLGLTSLAYTAVGAGDFTGSGVTDIAFLNRSTGDLGYIQATASGGTSWHDLGAASTAYAAIGVGDFTGSGMDDIAFLNTSTGDLGYIAVTASGGTSWHDLGAVPATYTAIGVADLDSTGVADIAFRDNATGDWGYYAPTASGGVTWHDVGQANAGFMVV